jgi:hypothetical protein
MFLHAKTRSAVGAGLRGVGRVGGGLVGVTGGHCSAIGGADQDFSAAAAAVRLLHESASTSTQVAAALALLESSKQ